MAVRASRALLGLASAFVCVSLVIAQDALLSAKLLSEVERSFGPVAKHRLLAWQDLILANQSHGEWQRLNATNKFFNRTRFVSDQEHWGKADYWATPVEMLCTDGGDCEDFSLAKYFTLKELAIPMQRMRLTYVKSLTLNQAHMVLAFYEYPEDEPLILDNLTNKIVPASARYDLLPVYSFNGDGLWLAKERGRGKRLGNADRIRPWQQVMRRMAGERQGLAPAHAGDRQL